MNSILKEFRDFAVKGNVVDLAIGVIIGGAFGRIVTSLVTDIVTPPIGLLLGGVNFTSIAVTLKPAITDAAGKVTTNAVTLNIGTFLQATFDFIIVALAMFAVVKVMNKLSRKTPPPPPTPTESKEVELLREIRDAIKAPRV